MAPIIGITTYGRSEKDLTKTHYDGYYVLPAAYVDAVRRAGGVPILLPPGEPQWEAWLPLVDGIIVAGGSDIDPSYYGGNREHPELTSHDVQRDETELHLSRHLLTTEQLPSLFICRGIQVLNVAAGGTLHEHLPEVTNTPDIHLGKETWTVESVQVEDGSLLQKVWGKNTAVTHSSHHQAIKEVGQGLKISSTTADGMIEALEKSGHPWLLGVQWHPEASAAENEDQQRLFDAFVKAATLANLHKDNV